MAPAKKIAAKKPGVRGGRKRAVHSEKRYKCKECDRTYANKRCLSMHMNVHKKTNCCQQCGKCFALLGDLKRHELIHSGMKPFSCSNCDASFTVKFAMQSHYKFCIKKDSTPRPFSCDQCDKSYPSIKSLVSHKNIHTDKYKCEVCNKRCENICLLAKHKRSHMEENDCGAGSGEYEELYNFEDKNNDTEAETFREPPAKKTKSDTEMLQKQVEELMKMNQKLAQVQIEAAETIVKMHEDMNKKAVQFEEEKTRLERKYRRVSDKLSKVHGKVTQHATVFKKVCSDLEEVKTGQNYGPIFLRSLPARPSYQEERSDDSDSEMDDKPFIGRAAGNDSSD